MLDLTVYEYAGQFVADSRNVAQMVNKQHTHLLRDIGGYAKILAESNFGLSDFFIETTYIDSTGRTLPRYDCTKKGCDMIANKLTGEKGVLFTAAYVTAFEKMHKAHLTAGGFAIPQTFPEALRLAANLAEQNERQQQLIGELKPKADYVDCILSSVGTMATGQIAADYGLTANKLNKILHDEGIQRKVGDQWILYKEHMGKGYTQSETIPITRTGGQPDTKLFTRWTQKGRLMINDVLNKRGIYANIEFKGVPA